MRIQTNWGLIVFINRSFLLSQRDVEGAFCEDETLAAHKDFSAVVQGGIYDGWPTHGFALQNTASGTN